MKAPVSTAALLASACLLCESSRAAEATTSQLGSVEESASVVTSVSFDGLATTNYVDLAVKGGGTWYGTCPTGASTKNKVVTTQTGDFQLVTGARIDVKFSNSNTHASPTLQVDGTAAKDLYTRAGYPVSYFWNSSEVVTFVYDGTRFVMEFGGTATTTYYGRTKLNSSTNSTSTSTAATPSAVKAVRDSIPTKVSQLVNDSGFVGASALSSYANKTYVGTSLTNLVTQGIEYEGRTYRLFYMEGEGTSVQSLNDLIQAALVQAAKNGITVDGHTYKMVEITQ